MAENPLLESRAVETGRKHEPNEVHVSMIVATIVIFGVVAALVSVGVDWLSQYYQLKAAQAAEGANTLAKRYDALPLNDRLADVAAPRLEGLRRLQEQSAFVRSSLPTAEGNSPQFHPEDFRPERQVRLTTYGWVDKDKGIVRIPVEEAMRAALTLNMFPTDPEPSLGPGPAPAKGVKK